ncbi:MAG: zf-HC2 domain-containing protein [Gemmatimonadota bacterium]|nr:MAG: zf-HC2 domain-containing protein [Gemmatimonadota bacterium]
MKMSHVDEGTLHAYLDGVLSESQRREVEVHLSSCIECQARLEQATALGERVSELMAELEPGPIQVPAWREIEARAAARRARIPRRSWVRPSLAWAASIAVAFAVGWFSRDYWSGLPGPLDVARKAEAPAAAGERTVGELETPDVPRSEEEESRRARAESFAEAIAEPAGAVAEAEEGTPDVPGVTVQGRGVAGEPQEPVAERRELAQPVAAVPESKREDRPAEAAVQDVAAPPEVPVEEPAVVGALEARARGQRERDQPADLVEQLRREAETAHAYAPDVVSLRPTAAAEPAPARFFSVQPEVASAWLGTPLRELPGLQLKRVDVGPGSSVEGGVVGLPAVQLVYEDAAGHEIILIQQYLGDRRIEGAETEPTLIVEPSGLRAYRWLDPQGYWLILKAAVSSDSLRALAERVR